MSSHNNDIARARLWIKAFRSRLFDKTGGKFGAKDPDKSPAGKNSSGSSNSLSPDDDAPIDRQISDTKAGSDHPCIKTPDLDEDGAPVQEQQKLLRKQQDDEEIRSQARTLSIRPEPTAQAGSRRPTDRQIAVAAQARPQVRRMPGLEGASEPQARPKVRRMPGLEGTSEPQTRTLVRRMPDLETSHSADRLDQGKRRALLAKPEQARDENVTRRIPSLEPSPNQKPAHSRPRGPEPGGGRKM